VGKKQKSMSIPLEYYKKLEKLLKNHANACGTLEISSPSELLRVLANLGEKRFLEIVEQVHTTRKKKP